MPLPTAVIPAGISSATVVLGKPASAGMSLKDNLVFLPEGLFWPNPAGLFYLDRVTHDGFQSEKTVRMAGGARLRRKFALRVSTAGCRHPARCVIARRGERFCSGSLNCPAKRGTFPDRRPRCQGHIIVVPYGGVALALVGWSRA